MPVELWVTLAIVGLVLVYGDVFEGDPWEGYVWKEPTNG